MVLVLPRRSLNLDFVRDGQASGDNYPTELSKLDSLFSFARASTATRWKSTNDGAVIISPTLLNGGFETAGAGGADVFADWVEATFGTTAIVRDTTTVFGGGASARIDVDGSNSAATLNRGGALIKGRRYLLACMSRTNKPGGLSTFQFGYGGAADAAVAIGNIPQNAWGPVVIEFVCGTTSTNFSLSRPSGALLQGYSVWFDNVTLTMLPMAQRELIASGQPRFDFDPLTLVCKGLLIEPQATNLIATSVLAGTLGAGPTGFFSAGGAMTNSQDLFVPYGSYVGKHVYIGSGDSNVGTPPGATVANGTRYTASVRLWLPSGPANSAYTSISLTAEGVASTTNVAAVIDATKRDQWQLVWVSFTATASGSMGTVLRNSNVAPIYSDSWQTEAGNFPTSWIPTTGTTATRIAEDVTATDLQPWYAAAPHTAPSSCMLRTDYTPLPGNDGTNYSYVLQIGQDNDNNLAVLASNNVANSPYMQLRANGVATYLGPTSQGSTGSRRRWAISYDGTTLRGYIEGVALLSVASPQGAPRATTFALGKSNSNVGRFACWIAGVTWMPAALSNTTLKAMTQ